MTLADLFGRIVAQLEAIGIPYMLTGSFATAFHGRPRATQAIDFVIAPTSDQLQALVRRLPPDQYYADEAVALEALRAESQFNVIDLATGWKIDFICRKSRAFSRTEFDRRRPASVEGRARELCVSSNAEGVTTAEQQSAASISRRSHQEENFRV